MASTQSTMLTLHNMKSFGLKIVFSKLDSASQFRAFALHDANNQEGHSGMRKHLIKYMRKHSDLFTPLMDIKVGDILRRNPSRAWRNNRPAAATQDYVDGAFDRYLDKIAFEDCPGDHITLKAFACSHKRDLLVIREDGCEIIREVEGQSTESVWAFAYDETTEQWAAVDGDGETSIKELIAGLPRQNFINKVNRSSTPTSWDGSTPEIATTTSEITQRRVALYDPLAPVKKRYRRQTRLPLPIWSRPAPECKAEPKILKPEPITAPVQELNDDELTDTVLIQTPKQYLNPYVQPKEEFVSQKRKRSDEELCFGKKKKTSPRGSTSPTRVSEPAKPTTTTTTTNSNKIFSSGIKRAAPIDDETESVPAKKQKVNRKSSISKEVRTSSSGSVATPPKTPSKVVLKSIRTIHHAPQPKSLAVTSTTEPKKSDAVPSAPAPIVKKTTAFSFGVKSRIAAATRTYRIEIISDEPKPQPIKVTTHAKVGPPPAPLKPTTTTKKGVAAPAKALTPKKNALANQSDTIAKAPTKKPLEKLLKFRKPTKGIKTANTRYYQPQGPGTFTITTPLPVFDFVPLKETADQREERLSQLSPLKRKQQEAKERISTMVYKTQVRSARKTIGAVEHGQIKK